MERGQLRLPSAGAGPGAYLAGATSSQTDLTATVSVGKPATGSGTYVWLRGRRVPGAGAAAFGGLAAWSVHVCLDWGWEMPSVSLMAVLLAAAVLDAEQAL